MQIGGAQCSAACIPERNRKGVRLFAINAAFMPYQRELLLRHAHAVAHAHSPFHSTAPTLAGSCSGSASPAGVALGCGAASVSACGQGNNGASMRGTSAAGVVDARSGSRDRQRDQNAIGC